VDRPRRCSLGQISRVASEFFEQLCFADRLFQMRAGYADRVHEAADILAENIILRVGIGGGVYRLRMGFQYMISLEKGLHRHLPVGRQDFLGVQRDIAVIHRPLPEMVR